MAEPQLHEHEVPVDDDLVRALLADQQPQWADLPLRRLTSTGTDHAIVRLGDHLVARLPRIGWAEQQVDREGAWLDHLGAHLPFVVPRQVAQGAPGHGYPFRWSVATWLPGVDALNAAAAISPTRLASDLARLLHALRQVPVLAAAPTPGKRGQALHPHDAVVRGGIERLASGGELDRGRALALWEQALEAAPWDGPPVWVHGDLLPGNLLVVDGGLHGVIDWSATGVGDPACDLQAAWSLPPDARAVLRRDLEVAGTVIDDATWARARGWVVEQTVAFIPYYAASLPEAVAAARQRLAAVLEDARPGTPGMAGA